MLAAIGQGAVVWLSLNLPEFIGTYDLDADGVLASLSVGGEFALRAAYATSDTLVTLIGAAVLTRIYRALPSEDAASDPDAA